MAPTTYEIKVFNNSNNSNKTYGIFSERAGVEGGGLMSSVWVLWAKLGPIGSHQQKSFKFDSDFYAFVGNSNVDSGKLETGGTVTLQTNRVVSLGSAYNKGSRLSVDKDRNITGSDTGATPQGTFTLGVVTGFADRHRYVVGVARKHYQDASGEIAPVAAVELKGGTEMIFTPKQKIIVALTTLQPGEVQAGAVPHAMAEVEFSGEDTVASVSEANDGTFSVTLR
jgi:hypothetical protein